MTTNLHLVGNFKKSKINKKCNLAIANDKDHVVELSKFLDSSRFNIDKNISSEESKMIKESWVSNFFSGHRGDGLIVYREKIVSTDFALFKKKDPPSY